MRCPDATVAALVVAMLFVAGCRSAPPTPPAPATPRVQRADVLVGDSFSPRSGEAAIRAFVPDVAPVDSGGECSTFRTPGSSATMVTASFPTRAAAHTQATVTFDSSGRLVRYSEVRGVAKISGAAGMSVAQRDSAFRAAINARRSTNITLDYPVDRAIVINRGGGRPTDAITGSVRAVESLERLGPIKARVERVRRLCGV